MGVVTDLAACVVGVLPLLRNPTVDRELMNDLWGTLHWGRHWGLHPRGMLRSNNLITEADQATLDAWLTAMGWAIAMTLDGQDRASAVGELTDLGLDCGEA